MWGYNQTARPNKGTGNSGHLLYAPFSQLALHWRRPEARTNQPYHTSVARTPVSSPIIFIRAVGLLCQ